MPMVRLVLGREFYQMFQWFNQGGFKADIPALRRHYPEIHLQTLERNGCVVRDGTNVPGELCLQKADYSPIVVNARAF